jgi:N-acetylmuramoyl-L-alanine amidase
MVFVLQQMKWFLCFQLGLLLLFPFRERHTSKGFASAVAVSGGTKSSLTENQSPSFLAIQSNNEPNERYHRVPAVSGDNIYTLLKRYQLHQHQCNFDRFYELNSLKKESQLIAGKEYYVPILIYKFNGQSIRSTVGIETWEQALRIKRYNEDLQEAGLRMSSVIASNILWVAYHELNCVDGKSAAPAPSTPAAKPTKETKVNNEATTVSNTAEKLKAEVKDIKDDMAEFKLDADAIKRLEGNAGLRKYPIFGTEHAHVALLDNSLNGKVFYVVSGHGGPDPGAIGSHGGKQLCEDEYAYDVALRLTRQLLQRGALVYMIVRDPNDGIRTGKYLSNDSDEYSYGNYRIPSNQKKRLFQRSNAINTLFEKHQAQGLKEQYCVEIHIDSRSKSENTDVFFYYFPGSMEGRTLALNMHKTFKEKYSIHRRDGSYHGTVTPRDLHMLREPKPTSVFIELGNIRNPSDQKRFVEESNREALAKWLYEGLIRK